MYLHGTFHYPIYCTLNVFRSFVCFTVCLSHYRLAIQRMELKKKKTSDKWLRIDMVFYHEFEIAQSTPISKAIANYEYAE